MTSSKKRPNPTIVKKVSPKQLSEAIRGYVLEALEEELDLRLDAVRKAKENTKKGRSLAERKQIVLARLKKLQESKK